MPLVRNILILAALTAASPAPAAAAFTLGDALLSRPVDELASATAVETYFDVDALLTLGALALAGGALAAAAWRPQASRKAPAVRATLESARLVRPRDAA